MIQCRICKTGIFEPGTTTVTLERDNTVVVTKNAPAQTGNNYGEYYLSDEVSSLNYALAEEAVKRKVVVEVMHYTA
jgi:hypothetical protein